MLTIDCFENDDGLMFDVGDAPHQLSIFTFACYPCLAALLGKDLFFRAEFSLQYVLYCHTVVNCSKCHNSCHSSHRRLTDPQCQMSSVRCASFVRAACHASFARSPIDVWHAGIMALLPDIPSTKKWRSRKIDE